MGWLFGYLLGAVVTFGVLTVVANSNDVPPREIVVTCVGEDSCSVPVLPEGWHADYRHNEWHITEGK
jgi:hypothetical protein